MSQMPPIISASGLTFPTLVSELSAPYPMSRMPTTISVNGPTFPIEAKEFQDRRFRIFVALPTTHVREEKGTSVLHRVTTAAVVAAVVVVAMGTVQGRVAAEIAGGSTRSSLTINVRIATVPGQP